MEHFRSHLMHFSKFNRWLACAAILLSTLAARADDGRPLEWVVGYPAGGGSDAVARAVGDQMGRILGRPVIINNKPGAATNIAADYVARSKDYGNVMFTADFATLAANPFLFSRLTYNAQKDFVPVGMLARFPMILVTAPNVPVNNLKEFIAYAQKTPGLTYASAGPGSPHHLATELFRDRTKLQVTHVPYRGAAPAVQDLLSGQVVFAMMDSAAVQQYIATGKLKAIGVATPQRLKVLPEIPTLAEQGLKGFEAYAWQGLVVPAGTKPEVVASLSKALRAALDTTMVKARFQTLALDGMAGTPEQMSTYVTAERARWGGLIRTAGIKLD
jgi:tripartite-type tricarboxylate transporter receptor subunit TctC